MANHDPDPTVVEADRRAERARASLRARFATLEQRLDDVRTRIDVPEQIRRHPLPAIGIAFALGALAGHRGARVASQVTERSFGGAVLAALGAIGLRIAREVAVMQLGRAARRWIDDHEGRSPGALDATIQE
ncbi:MAG TPA: hypothetical protein VIX73_22585 [Kofleriaceae bacterium]|jgi:hypothetical protein